nr:MAG TPA: protein of unknown function (DUF5484) [Bacteriophage sp.]
MESKSIPIYPKLVRTVKVTLYFNGSYKFRVPA